MSKIIFILTIFIFLGCQKVDSKEVRAQNTEPILKKQTKEVKKYSGKALEQTKYTDAIKNIGKKQAVMLEVGSDSCKSCKEMALMLQELKEDYPKFKVFFIDVGKERIAAKELKIQMIPTQVFYDEDGKEIFRHIGKYKNKELIVKKLNDLGFKL